ncbi:MAG: FAD-dependent oxidoreductase, partial [Candidatus Hinthialibacter sp.]
YQQFEKGQGYRPRNEEGGFFQWYIELGGMQDTIYDAEEIRDELFRINLGLWNYVKNHHPDYQEKNKSRRLTWINYAPGKRESRRLEGDYILTQWDYADQIIHEDNVAYGGWGVDVHHPNGFWKSGPMYYSAYRGQHISIPFRSLYSKNVSNLMMAGRDASVSHVALGGVRVMRTTCLMGQATGAAAAICVEKNVNPREAGKKYIHAIQQRLMKSGAYIMGQRNEDPDDLALQAKASASSVKTIPDPKVRLFDPNTPLIHDLNMQRAVMFQPNQNRIEEIALHLRSSNHAETPIRLTLRKAEAFGDFSSNADLASAEAAVPPNSQGWVRFPLHVQVNPDDYYYVFLPPQKGLQWDLFPVRKENACRAYGGPNWTRRDECYTYTLAPGEVEEINIPQIALEADGVIDGYNRVVDGDLHSWGPDPQQELPQWIELRFDEEKQFNTIHVSFQNYEYLCPKYLIQAERDGEWETLIAVENNQRRRNVHPFPTVVSEAIRLVLNAPANQHPEDSAQICEIRIYDESR